MNRLLACLLVATATGCPDVKVDPNEVGAAGPTVEFDPARSLAEGARYIPFPTDLVRDPETGKLALSSQACESPTALATRVGILNTLDGFGTYEVPIQVTFTEEFDEASLADNVVLYKITSVGPAATPVPIVTRKTTTLRVTSGTCTTPETVNALVVIPAVPLAEKTTYILALKKGITSAGGEPFSPSYTWGLVSAKQSPVTLDANGNVVADRTPLDPADEAQRVQLRSLFGLWKSLEAPLLFLDQTPFMTESGATRADLLVATSFTTQTITDPLDPLKAGSPAAELSQADFLVDPTALSFGPYMALCTGGETPAECVMKLALGGCAPATTGCSVANYTAGTAACGLYACAAVGNVLVGAIGTTNYQKQIPNPTAGLPVKQGAWSDPLHPTAQGSLALQTIAMTPAGTAPADGWPVVVFGHGLANNKENLFAIGGKLAVAGFASIAIDFSQHGSRAVRTSTDVALGCMGHCYSAANTDTGVECETTGATAGPGVCDALAGETCGSQAVSGAINPPSPSSAPQCYEAIFSADLTVTRDNIRQTILDLERVVNTVKACGTTNCGAFQADPDRIFYGGISLGSLIGATAASIHPDVKGAALNVGGVGWLDVIENTATKSLQCSLVNSLIDAGVVSGEKWTPSSTTDVCTTGAWKLQPGYATFSAVARWVLDSADAANFVVRLRGKPHMIQEVVGDMVVPNVAQEREAAITGVAAEVEASSAYNPGAPTSESAAISTMPLMSKYITYTTDANHTYAHGSLLKPAAGTAAAQAATARMQIDFAQFLDNIDDDSL
jgi:pimeloyl-ACP methyl ester carboxylesterase